MFARGGGGGSSSGGGGGSSSADYFNDSGSSIGMLIAFFIVFAIGVAYLTDWILIKFFSVLRKKNKKTKRLLVWGSGFLITTVGVVLIIFSRQIYGPLEYIPIGVSIGLLLSFALGIPVGLSFGLDNSEDIAKQATSSKFSEAAKQDPELQPEALSMYVNGIFLKYQSDWTNFNLQSMQGYLSQNYFRHMQLVLTALRNLARQNIVSNARANIDLQEINMDDPAKPYFIAKVEGSVLDSLVSTKDNHEIASEEDVDFTEFWRFIKENGQWKLDDIKQETEQDEKLQNELKLFAQKNGMYYAADWGHLLLPEEGELFVDSEFGVADINNHIIGHYKNILIELYTYTSSPDDPVAEDDFLIAQATLPKTYGNIIVEHRRDKLFHRKPPNGMQTITLEWPDFNSKYQVFATTIEQVTAFELLHPVFMEKLFALDFDISIEVVGNILYLYTGSQVERYSTMLEILKEAFSEMKL